MNKANSRGKPRVLFVLPATVMGGAEIRLLQMVNQFRSIEPILLGHARVIDSWDLNIESYLLDSYPGCVHPYPYDPLNVAKYARAIATVGNAVSADGTFGWMHTGSAFVAAAKTFYRLRGGTAGCVLGPLTTNFRLMGRAPTLYERFLFRRTCRALDLTVTCSRGVADDLHSNFGAPRGKLLTIHNGVDVNRSIRLAGREDEYDGPQKRRPWVVAAGRLSMEKAFDVLIESFGKVSESLDADLMILGEGPERARLEAIIDQRGLQGRVCLVGHKQNPFPWLARADVFVSSSRIEGFGNSLVEAMGLGVPIVATACPWGPVEILEGYEAGLLVPVDDIDQLAGQIVAVLSDSDLRRQLADAGKRRAQDFTFERMLGGYEDVLVRLFGNATD